MTSAGFVKAEDRAAHAARIIALQMMEERGRGAVLVGVARVDSALEHLLEAVMTPGLSKSDRLFLPDKPLGSLGAKVALASRLGLLDPQVERALEVLRKLRNAFAHSTESASLNDSPHSERLANVYSDARLNPLWHSLETALTTQAPVAQPPLEPALLNFILLITILVAFLEAVAHQQEPFKPAVVMRFSHEPKPEH
jgi:hypothetical protein